MMLKSILSRLRSSNRDDDAERPRTPWVTYWSTAACVAIFLGINTEDHVTLETLAKWGYFPAYSIWQGAFWGLVTSAFTHLEIWHLAFNVYWLAMIGTRIEAEINTWRFLALMISSAFVSSALQMTLGGETGIGASGIGYALFGFAWMLRDRVPSFAAVLTPRNVNIFLIWLFGCVIATYLDLIRVANIAHFAGLAFGVTVAHCFVRRDQLKRMVPLLVGLIVLSIVPLFWCPWSVTWLSIKAYNAHYALRYDDALGYYNKIIQAQPTNAWALQNRGTIHSIQGQDKQAQSEWDAAKRIEASSSGR